MTISDCNVVMCTSALLAVTKLYLWDTLDFIHYLTSSAGSISKYWVRLSTTSEFSIDARIGRLEMFRYLNIAVVCFLDAVPPPRARARSEYKWKGF